MEYNTDHSLWFAAAIQNIRDNYNWKAAEPKMTWSDRPTNGSHVTDIARMAVDDQGN